MQVWSGTPSSHSQHRGLPFMPPFSPNSSDKIGPDISILVAALFHVHHLTVNGGNQ